MSTPPDPSPPADPGTPPPALEARRKERAPYLPLCIVLAGLALLLVRQNLALREQIRSLLQQRSPEALRVGEQLAALPTFGPAGEKVDWAPADALRFDDGRSGTVLFVFSGSCQACEASLPAIVRLIEPSKAAAAALIAVQTDANEPASLTHVGLGFPVRGIPNARETWLKRIDAVPAVLIISPTGVISHARWGIPDDAQEREIALAISALADAPRTKPVPSPR